ncbi:gustatory receptor for sugar taste 43a-like [Choristoneura fumiferana]|uniref:gustatory receptor for sugar taste 43a-like n=1 Tax=Choristoneura fumiferana TaxID=7141 RepID=UPI003D15EEC3
MVMANSFRLVLSPYYLLLNIFDEDDVVMSHVLLQGNWIAFHIVKLLLITEPCHWIQEQREHTEFLLSQLTVHLAPKSESVSKEIDQFAKQVVLNKAKFMPLGIFSLSRPLIVTILSSVTTHLIIIIQFQQISTHL